MNTRQDRFEATSAFLAQNYCELLDSNQIKIHSELDDEQIKLAKRIKPELLALLKERQNQILIGPKEAQELLDVFQSAYGSISKYQPDALIAWAPRHVMANYLYQIGKLRKSLAELDALDKGHPKSLPAGWLSVVLPICSQRP